MVSFLDFSNLPKPGEVSICEQNGRLCSLPVSEINSSQSGNFNIGCYADINISRELFHHSSNLTLLDDHKTVLLPVSEPLIKKITRVFFEEGAIEALKVASNIQNATTNPILNSMAKYLLYMVDIGNKVQIFFQPHLKDQGVVSIAKFSQTRDWGRSIIRYITWHPNFFKMAVAACDDSIRVYTEENNVVPVLKSPFQKCISSMAWRPFTAGELAVGCQNGVFIWSLDPKSTPHFTRPFSQAVQLKHGSHFPVISLEWNYDGSLLATASTADSNILIWDVDLGINTPLKRVGAPCSLLKWSPDGYRLCSTTVGNVFRVWTTDKWIPERWTVPYGSIQSAAWSPCGGYLLFVTTDESILYSLRFLEELLFATDAVSKQALPVADLTKITVDQIEVGGRPQSIAWDANGQHLAITFKDSPVIAVFLTTINRHLMNIAPACFLIGIGAEVPSYICFQEIYPNKPKAVLTIGWSSGRVQYFPFV